MTTKFNNLPPWLLPVAAVIALLLLVAAMAGLFSERLEPGLADNAANSHSAVFDVEEVTRTVYEPVAASLHAKQSTDISARVMAPITSILVRAGDTVKQGQLLAQLDDRDFALRRDQAREQVTAMEARFREAQKNLTRMAQLFEQKMVAQAEYDRARSQNDNLKAQLSSARKALQEAETALSFTRITAPIDGRIVDRFAEPGDTVSPGNRLLSLYNPFSLQVEARVREHLALRLQKGQPMMVEIPSLQRELEARVEEIVPAADTGSRSFLVKAQIPYDTAFLPGMYTRLLIPAGEQQSISIPEEYIAKLGQLDMVWVSGEQGPQARYIRTGQEVREGYREVLSGLAAGEQILPVPVNTP